MEMPGLCAADTHSRPKTGHKGCGSPLKKRFYIVFVSRDEQGNLNKVPVPLHYAYIFVAAAVVGLFTIVGLAGSYSRMLIKTARFNQMRQDRESLRQDYARLQKANHEKDVQVASLGALANEVSALYGLTASKLTGASSAKLLSSPSKQQDPTLAPIADSSYFKSLDTFYALRNSASSGVAARVLAPSLQTARLGSLNSLSDWQAIADAPTLWPVMGPITSSFGQREDPILGNGEGEFHKGVDISAPYGTPIRATADGVVENAAFGNGYGREVVIDHGHGLQTVYAHMSGFNVTAGQQVTRGQIIGYAGRTGRSTGSHLHYEVRIRNTPVNPHKYLRESFAGMVKTAGDS